MKQPDQPAGPAFDKAADKIAYLENHLTDLQKPYYEAFLKAQEKDKERQKAKADHVKAEYDLAKQKNPSAKLEHNHPAMARIKNPYLDQKAALARAEHHKLERLGVTQQNAKVKFLEKLGEQRTKQQLQKPEDRYGRDLVEQFRQKVRAQQPKEKQSKMPQPVNEAAQAALVTAWDKVQQQEAAREQNREQDQGLSRSFNKP